MGDVKRSGKTFEERKAIAIAKQKAEAEQKMAKRVEVKLTKTPEQKLEENRSRIILEAILRRTMAPATLLYKKK